MGTLACAIVAMALWAGAVAPPCTVTIPTGCDCPTGATVEVDWKITGNICSIVVKRGIASKVTPAVKTTMDKACLDAPCGNNTVKVCITPSVAWQSVTSCSELTATCGPI